MRVDDLASNIRPSLPMRVALVRGRRSGAGGRGAGGHGAHRLGAHRRGGGAQQGQPSAARQLLLVLGPHGECLPRHHPHIIIPLCLELMSILGRGEHYSSGPASCVNGTRRTCLTATARTAPSSSSSSALPPCARRKPTWHEGHSLRTSSRTEIGRARLSYLQGERNCGRGPRREGEGDIMSVECLFSMNPLPGGTWRRPRLPPSRRRRAPR